MQSSKIRFVFGLLIMVVGVAGILIKFDKLPGVRLGSNGQFKLGGEAADASRDEDKKPSLADYLRLGGLSGPPARRLAIVNNVTFAAGESARVEVRGELVKVRCQEIRTNSAVVHVEGTSEPVEIFLEGVSVPDSGAKVSPRLGRTTSVPHPTGSTARAEITAEKVGLISGQVSTNVASVKVDEATGGVEVNVGGQKIQIRE